MKSRWMKKNHYKILNKHLFSINKLDNFFFLRRILVIFFIRLILLGLLFFFSLNFIFINFLMTFKKRSMILIREVIVILLNQIIKRV